VSLAALPRLRRYLTLFADSWMRPKGDIGLSRMSLATLSVIQGASRIGL
jgi:hypothetical protein